MKIALSGAGGFIGAALTRELKQAGHEVTPLRRGIAPGEGYIAWDPAHSSIDLEALSRADGIIHLGGKPLAGLWTQKHLRECRESREENTRFLAESAAKAKGSLKFMVVASAIGYYGHRPYEALDENSGPGQGVLADIAGRWESAADPARAAGLRVVHPRIGLVLGQGGGALGPMLPLFRLGLGGRLGSGAQVMSWISLRDTVRAIRLLAEHTSFAGAVNLCSPNPISNRGFTRALGKALGRPAFFHAPAFALRLLLGKMADEMLLSSAQVYPKALAGLGFQFEHPHLEEALKFILERKS